MTAEFVISDGDTVNVSYQSSEWVSVEVLNPPTVGVVQVQGPQGPQGPSGPSYEGVAWFFGQGEPGTILGSKPGDFFLSTDTGVVYVLGGN